MPDSPPMTSGFVHWASVPAAPEGSSGVWFIYALVDPRDEGVRYVGVTDKALADRLRGHLRKPTNGLMRSWLSDVRASGLLPSIRLLSAPLGHWEHAEQGWIAWFRRRGQLLNVDPGGMARTKGGKLKRWARKLNRKAKWIAAGRPQKRQHLKPERRPPPENPLSREAELAAIAAFIHKSP